MTNIATVVSESIGVKGTTYSTQLSILLKLLLIVNVHDLP